MDYIFHFFLQRYKSEDFVTFSRARLTFNFCLVTALFSLLYIGIAFLVKFQTSVVVMTALAFLFTGCAFLIRTKISLTVISQVYLLLSFIGSVILIQHSGQMYSSILPWLSFLPLSANLLIGRKAAFIWLGVTCVTIAGFIFTQDHLSDIAVRYDKNYEKIFFAVVYSGLAGIILVLSMVFQKAKDNVLKALEEKSEIILSINLELKNKNNEISAQNEALIQQKEEIAAQREFIEIKNRELLLVQDELNNLVDKLTATQNELAGREAENRSILDAIYGTKLIVAEMNLQGQFLKISPMLSEMLQLSESDILGKTFAEISQKTNIVINDPVDLKSMWKSVLADNNANLEKHLAIKDKEYWLQQNFFPIQGNDGTPEKVMIVAQDISQIKNQQSEIEMLNIDLKENIWRIEKQNHQLLTQQKEIETINTELKRSNEEIRNINQNLESKVKDRTKYLESQNRQLSEYAYINAHLLRGPLCSILGLVHLMNISKESETDPVIFHMKKSTRELSNVVDKITKAIEKGAHFDRSLLFKN